MKFKVWQLRIILLLYFAYKIFFALFFNTRYYNQLLTAEDGVEMAGSITAYIFIFVLLAFCYLYQIRQIGIEKNQSTGKNRKSRLLSIIVSVLILQSGVISLTKIDFSRILADGFNFYFYVAFTLIALVIAVPVLKSDIKLLQARRA